MKDSRFYKVLIAMLLLLNIGTLIFIWLNRPAKEIQEKRPDAALFLIRELSLDDNQQKAFLILRDEHKNKLEQLSSRDKTLHREFFDLLLLLPPDTMKARLLADSISLIRREMEIVTYNHFYEVTRILNTAQQKKFAMIFHDVLRMVLPPPPNPPRPPAPGQEVNPPVPGEPPQPPPFPGDRKDPPPPLKDRKGPPPLKDRKGPPPPERDLKGPPPPGKED